MKKLFQCIILIGIILVQIISYSWLPKEVAENIIKDFEEKESVRQGNDWRSSAPFITGNGFRLHCQHICDDSNRCRMTPENVKNGECIFVKSDFFDFFVKEVTNRINGSYIIVSHNGDLSTPDGQDDAPRLGMPRYVTSDILQREYDSKRLIAHHGQNIWWKNYSFNHTRPEFLHCIPLGLENRQYSMGKKLHVYIDAFKRNVISRPNYTIEEEEKLPLLLIAFYPKSRIPDRFKVLDILGAIPPKGQPKPNNTFYNDTDLSHEEWLDAIPYHRFVLAPFGHGLDTHRITEILMMGGIPVMRRSSISSCYDDSDNNFGNTTRGSLPVVILESWNNLTKERLEIEWKRIVQHPKEYWDWKRVFLYHWLDRIGMN